jgi:hypothetical protein
MERLKAREYGRIYANDYFWRTWEQQEVDLLEDMAAASTAMNLNGPQKKCPGSPRHLRKAIPTQATK